MQVAQPLIAHAVRPVALITGGAKRLGQAIALHLAQAGYDIALHYGRSAQEASQTADQLRQLGARVSMHAADLADQAQVQALIPAVLQAHQRLDAVINNASLFEYDNSATVSYESIQVHHQINVAAPVLLAQGLHAHIAQQLPEHNRRGCVVNLLDQKLYNYNPDYFAYTCSKAALAAATVMQAQALAPLVRVAGVAPGVTLVSGPMNEGQFEAAHQLTPLGRSSTPVDIARAVLFMLQSPAVTGSTLVVDGGQHLTAQSRDVMFLVNSQ